MSELYLLLFAALAIAVAWRSAHPSAVFVVSARDGASWRARGQVTDAFLAAVTEVCREFDVGMAEVRGVARGERIALHFSSSWPQAARQRLRNWWAMSGWSAKPRSRR
jgi:hypothetical protein